MTTRQAENLIKAGTVGSQRICAVDTHLRMYRVFDERMLVMSESSSMMTHIHAYLRNLETPVDSAEKATLRLAVFNAPRRHTILCCPEAGMANRFPQGTKAWYGFRRLLMNFVLVQNDRYFPIHACCVADNGGKTLLIAGLSMAGKTTVTAALLQRGYRFACDDNSLLCQDGHVVAFPTGSTVSRRTFDTIPEIRPLRCRTCSFNANGSREWTVNLGDVFPVVTPYDVLRPSHFFFLTPNFGGRSAITPCAREAGVWHFLNSRVRDRELALPLREYGAARYGCGFRAMENVLDETRFFDVVNGEVQATADLIYRTVLE